MTIEEQRTFQFILREAVRLEPLLTILCRLFAAPAVAAYSEMGEADLEAVPLYEHLPLTGPFKVLLNVHLFGPRWTPFYARNSILDLGRRCAIATGSDVVVSADDPLGVEQPDWILFTPFGQVYRVQEALSSDYDFEVEPAWLPLSDADLQALRT